MPGGHLFLRLLVLIGVLVYGFSPVKSGFFGIVSTHIFVAGKCEWHDLPPLQKPGAE